MYANMFFKIRLFSPASWSCCYLHVLPTGITIIEFERGKN